MPTDRKEAKVSNDDPRHFRIALPLEDGIDPEVAAKAWRLLEVCSPLRRHIDELKRVVSALGSSRHHHRMVRTSLVRQSWDVLSPRDPMGFSTGIGRTVDAFFDVMNS